MIEQTELIVTGWHYHPPLQAAEMGNRKIVSNTSLEVMKKRAADKKGIACRFTCIFKMDNEMILEYVGEDSYVIDLADMIDKNELKTMIRNSHAKFKEKFELRKFGTALQHTSLGEFDVNRLDLDAILPLLHS